ncbi:MAG: Gfo/Idh/MocA family oxidoreductase [Planctomycetaceae bacterium]
MLRLGIVDFDSSHSIEFTRRFNHVGLSGDEYVQGARVVLGCPGTSEMSPERIPLFTEQVRDEGGVKLVDNPEEMIGDIDAVLILSLCGSAHLERARPFLEAGIPTYIDKPFACNLSDAEEMIRLAQENNATLFHSSGLRFAEEILNFQRASEIHGRLNGVMSYGPAKRAEGNPGLFHYGIHAVSILFALMGPGCESVTTIYTEGAEVVSGRWRDGRIGTLRGNRAGSTAYGFLAFCDNSVENHLVSTRWTYRNLCQQIVNSFTSGVPTVPHECYLEETRFVLASLESERRDGVPIRLESIS